MRSICSSLSTAHGPAITISPGPPSLYGPTGTMVSSCLKVATGQLIGLRDAHGFTHAGQAFKQVRVEGAGVAGDADGDVQFPGIT